MFSKKYIYIALLAIILLGAFLRLYKLGNNSFVADEFLDINSSYAYFKTEIWQNWDFNFGKVNSENIYQARDERAWIYKWQVAQIFKFFPPTEAAARSISAFWGIFTIFLIYLVGTYFTKKKTIGLLSSFLFAVSVSGIVFDRRLRMYAMFLPVYLLFSWMLYRFMEEGYGGKIGFLKKLREKFGLNLLFLVPTLFLGSVSFLTHQLTANIIAVLAAYLIFGFVLEYKESKKWLNKYLVLSGLGITGIIGAILLVPEQVSINLSVLRLFNDHFEYFLISLEDYSHLIIAAMFLALGLYFLIKKQKLSKEGIWLVVSFLVPLLLAAFVWKRNVGAQYIFFIKPFGTILVASGIYFVAKFFSDNLSAYGKKAYLAVIVLSLIVLPNYAYFFQKDNVYNQTSESENPDYRRVFTYFKKYKKDGDVLIARNFRNYYWSGAKVKVFDFGGELAEEKLSLGDVKKIIGENPSGWAIISENDESYIANDAMAHMEKNLEQISNVQVRGKIKVLKWGS